MPPSKPKHGMTAFLIDITDPSMTTERLRNMDTEKVARFYKIPATRVETYRRWQLGQQGGGA